jgi:hypothetical protein
MISDITSERCLVQRTFSWALHAIIQCVLRKKVVQSKQLGEPEGY